MASLATALTVHPSDILYRSDLFHLQKDIISYALELALLGAIDHARELCSIILTFGPISPNATYRQISELRFAWEHTSSFPDRLPLAQRSNEQLILFRAQNAGAWGEVTVSSRTMDQAGIDSCLNVQARAWGYTDKQLVKALEISIQLNPTGREPYGSMKVSDLDEQSAGIVRQIAVRWKTAAQGLKESLAAAESLWPYFACGVLADALDYKPQDIKKQAGMIVGAVHQRLQTGHAETMFAAKRMEELLRIGDYNTTAIFGPGRTVWDAFGMPMPETMLSEPATPSSITDAETRLGLALPADYKEFLDITNGLGTDGAGFHDGVIRGPHLVPIEKVAWKSQSFDFTLHLIEFGDLLYSITGSQRWIDKYGEGWESWDMTEDIPKVDQAIIIGEADVTMVLLIPPDDVERVKEEYLLLYAMAEGEYKRGFERAIEGFAGSMQEFKELEWIVLAFDDGVETGFRSFRRWLEEQVAGSFYAR